jgi:hypothetical protein
VCVCVYFITYEPDAVARLGGRVAEQSEEEDDENSVRGMTRREEQTEAERKRDGGREEGILRLVRENGAREGAARAVFRGVM